MNRILLRRSFPLAGVAAVWENTVLVSRPSRALMPSQISAAAAAEQSEVLLFPGSPFRLHQPFAPAGDQPEAIERLVEGIQDGLSFQTLLGVTGSGKTYTMANVIARLARPTLILAPNKTLAAQLYSEMREFFPENAVEYFVSYYDYYQPEARRATCISRRTPVSTSISSRCACPRPSRCSSGRTR